jgi:hypothetical protein
MNRILFQGFERVFVGCMALVKGAWGVRVGAGSGVSGGTPLPLCCAGAGIGGMRRPLANERGGGGWQGGRSSLGCVCRRRAVGCVGKGRDALSTGGERGGRGRRGRERGGWVENVARLRLTRGIPAIILHQP